MGSACRHAAASRLRKEAAGTLHLAAVLAGLESAVFRVSPLSFCPSRLCEPAQRSLGYPTPCNFATLLLASMPAPCIKHLVVVAVLLFAGLAPPAALVQGRRLAAAAAPAPAPSSALDHPSGGGAGCVGSAAMLPEAGPALSNTARSLLEQCGTAEASQETCGAVLSNATYMVAAVYALTFSLTTAEEFLICKHRERVEACQLRWKLGSLEAWKLASCVAMVAGQPAVAMPAPQLPPSQQPRSTAALTAARQRARPSPFPPLLHAAECAGETVSAASSLYEYFQTGVQEGCLNPAAAADAGKAGCSAGQGRWRPGQRHSGSCARSRACPLPYTAPPAPPARPCCSRRDGHGTGALLQLGAICPALSVRPHPGGGPAGGGHSPGA